MKKFIKQFAALLLSVSMVATFAFSSIADEKFQTAKEAVDSISVGWNLGNTLDSYGTWINGKNPADYEKAWGNPKTSKAMIDSVKDQGFNAIRIPVTWSQHIDSKGNVDDKWMARVKEIVDYAYDDGLYVILNVHHDNGEGGGDKVSWIFAETDTFDSVKDKYQGLWKNIANEFKDYGDHLLFEGYNEVLDKNNTWNAPGKNSSYDAINSYAQLFVDTVRATGGNNAQRNLIVTTYVASVDQGCLDNLKIPSDTASDHIIAEVHVYAPWGFTGTKQSVTWTSVHNDFGDSDKREIDDIMNRLNNFSKAKGVPVIIGECGAEYKQNEDQIAKYANYLVDKAGQNGIKCFYWDNGQYGTGNKEGGYAIFDRASLKWKTEITEALVNASKPYVTEQAEQPAETSATSETEVTSEATEMTTTTVEETTVTETTETVVSEETVETDVEVVSEESHISGVTVFVIVDVILVAGALFTSLIFLKKKKSMNK